MEHAVYDLVLRMTAGRADVARLCGEAVSGLGDGDVCRALSPAERLSLRDAGSVVAFADAATAPADVHAPFVVEGALLYTRRNWQYERNVKARLDGLSAQTDAVALPRDEFYGSLRPDQRHAVEVMCRRQFAILTGGPGTGKTHTLARAVRFVRDRQPGLRLGLAAPTGKAAARMRESMARAMEDVPDALTIHSLLKPNHDLVTFRHDRDNPLPLDWLIVDEASMIGLPLMSRLLDALPDGCRLTLVGDADQLASVERGRVFGDLCRRCGASLCRLTTSRRFPPDGEIARLAAAVNGNRPDRALDVLRGGGRVSFQDVSACPPFRFRSWPGFAALVREKFAALSACADPRAALAHLNDFKVLCAVREGPFGVEHVNRFVADLLGGNCPLPMMVVQNDALLGVVNGDVGVVMPDDPARLHLPAGDGVRSIRLELLPRVETAFASTIHKAQGSEFTDVALVLPPDGANPLLTREVLYTGITRTQERVFVYAGEDAIRRCCMTSVARVSGLALS
ncbi:MAG: exodeoxyribonuclease V subunit alpha [Kiritimatiellia bacterium]